MFIVEGNIGAGKSTFLKLLHDAVPYITVIYEPLLSWHSQEHGQSLLANFYNDTPRWAYTMETFAMVSRVQEHLKEQEHLNPLRIMERSIYSGHYCFALNDYKNGYLTALEWKIYLEWFDFLIAQKCKIPNGFIYLQVDPQIAFERTQKRQRNGETSIKLEYLEQVHDCHEQFLVHKINILPSLQTVPVLTLNCNEEFEANTKQCKEHIDKVIAFIELYSLAVFKEQAISR